MRRKDREVTDFSEIVSIIEKCDVCRIALNDENFPYIIPLNFGLNVTEDNVIELYFHGATEGTKLKLIEKDNRASFEADCEHRLVTDAANCSCTMEYRSVIGRGHIEMIPDEEKYEALCILMKHYHMGKVPFEFDESVMKRTAVFKLVVENVTGKVRMKSHDNQ